MGLPIFDIELSNLLKPSFPYNSQIERLSGHFHECSRAFVVLGSYAPWFILTTGSRQIAKKRTILKNKTYYTI